MGPDTIITVDEASEMLRCEPETIEELLRTGQLPGLKFGRSWVLHLHALLDHVYDVSFEQMEERATQKPVASTGASIVGLASKRVPPALPVLP